MLIATSETQKMAMLALIQQLYEMGVDVPAAAERAKLQILGSHELYMMPAEFRVRCASVIDELITEAVGIPSDSEAFSPTSE